LAGSATRSVARSLCDGDTPSSIWCVGGGVRV
jgi:hypothetical protein